MSFDGSTLGHVLTIVLIKCVKNIFTMRVVNLQEKKKKEKKKTNHKYILRRENV